MVTELHCLAIARVGEKISTDLQTQLCGQLNAGDPSSLTWQAGRRVLSWRQPLERAANLLATRRSLEAAAAAAQVDVLTITTEQLTVLKRPRALFADMDMTMLREESLDRVAEKAGVADQVRELTELGMQGKLDFTHSLRLRLQLLRGQPERFLHEVAASVQITPGANEFIQCLRQLQTRCVLVSGGINIIAAAVATKLGFEQSYANHLVITNGLLTGELTGEIVDTAYKGKILLDLCKAWGVDPRQTVAIGDGSNDLLMLQNSGYGISFRGKSQLNQIADCNLRWNDLSVLVWLLKLATDSSANQL